jgi:membrane protein
MSLNHGATSKEISEHAVSATDGRRLAGAPGASSVRSAAVWQIAQNVFLRIGRDNLMLVAAGVAFYAMTAIFPAIAAFVSIYGLFADPHAVQAQIAGFPRCCPTMP